VAVDACEATPAAVAQIIQDAVAPEHLGAELLQTRQTELPIGAAESGLQRGVRHSSQGTEVDVVHVVPPRQKLGAPAGAPRVSRLAVVAPPAVAGEPRALTVASVTETMAETTGGPAVWTIMNERVRRGPPEGARRSAVGKRPCLRECLVRA